MSAVATQLILKHGHDVVDEEEEDNEPVVIPETLLFRRALEAKIA